VRLVIIKKVVSFVVVSFNTLVPWEQINQSISSLYAALLRILCYPHCMLSLCASPHAILYMLSSISSQ
jgi:hypothetical protein